MKEYWKHSTHIAADIFRMTALIEFYTHKSVSDLSEEDIGREFAKLVYVLEWQSEQVDGRV